jgi:hypothetical protein
LFGQLADEPAAVFGHPGGLLVRHPAHGHLAEARHDRQFRAAFRRYRPLIAVHTTKGISHLR